MFPNFQIILINAAFPRKGLKRGQRKEGITGRQNRSKPLQVGQHLIENME